MSGPNGAGKTTLLRVAANVLRPARGRRIGRPRLAYVPAAVDPPLLQAGAWLAGVRRARRVPPTSVLEQLGFDGALDRPCRELSFGNLRKVLLADAFSSLADLIVIDEATEGLDSRGAAALVELMVETRSRGAGVLFAEQQTQRMVGADRLVSLRHGTLVVESLSGGEVTVSLRGPAASAERAHQGCRGARVPVHRGARMIAFNLRLGVRSMRWLGPALILMVWILASLSDPGPALTNAGNMFLLLVAVSCWLTVTIGNVDDDGHRELLAAAIGSPARLHRSRAISAYIAANTVSAVGHARVPAGVEPNRRDRPPRSSSSAYACSCNSPLLRSALASEPFASARPPPRRCHTPRNGRGARRDHPPAARPVRPARTEQRPHHRSHRARSRRRRHRSRGSDRGRRARRSTQLTAKTFLDMRTEPNHGRGAVTAPATRVDGWQSGV